MHIIGVRAPLTVTGTVEARIAAVADRQRGRVSRRQLLTVGVSDQVIRRLLAHETLRRRHRGVYVYGHAAEVPFGEEMAALLSCGEFAWLAGTSAGAVWQLRASPRDAAIHLVVPMSHSARGPAQVIVHRSRSLTPADVTVHRGLPVTTPERTLLDIGDTESERCVEQSLDEALGLRITSRTKMRELLARSPGRHGAPLLHRLIDPQRPSSRTRSVPEERILGALRQAGIEQPECNVDVSDYNCDFYFRRAGVVVEFQSFQWHASRFTFTRDRRKRRALERAGLVVVELIAEDLTDNLLATTAELVQTVTRRTIERASAGPHATAPAA